MSGSASSSRLKVKLSRILRLKYAPFEMAACIEA
jgi:hypothetical protein